jgi:hypothetical protein
MEVVLVTGPATSRSPQESPLAQQIAQVREALEFVCDEHQQHPHPSIPLAALSVIERHVQDMEKALDEEIALHAREARQHAQERDSDGENWHLAVADALRDVRDGMRGRMPKQCDRCGHDAHSPGYCVMSCACGAEETQLIAHIERLANYIASVRDSRHDIPGGDDCVRCKSDNREISALGMVKHWDGERYVLRLPHAVLPAREKGTE